LTTKTASTPACSSHRIFPQPGVPNDGAGFAAPPSGSSLTITKLEPARFPRLPIFPGTKSARPGVVQENNEGDARSRPGGGAKTGDAIVYPATCLTGLEVGGRLTRLSSLPGDLGWAKSKRVARDPFRGGGFGFAADRFWRESIGVRAHVFSLPGVAVVTWITRARRNGKQNL
jgi:hypothetical protein